MSASDAGHPVTIEPLRLGFARGVSPNKWARRWAEAAVPNNSTPLELVPFDLAGHIEYGYLAQYVADPGAAEAGKVAEPTIDVVLERIRPGEYPTGTTGSGPTRRAVRLYTESVALVISADHELAKQQMVDRETLELITLLPHPDHLPAWPTPEPWRDDTWAPADAAAAMELVATGAGAILLSLPLARHLAGKRNHAVLPVTADPPLPGTEIWASWDVGRDDVDVQQLVGVLRGRTSHSGRTAQAELGRTSPTEAPPKPEATAPQRRVPNKPKNQKPLPKNSRGAQLAAAKSARQSGKKRAQSAKNKKRGGR